MQAYLTNSVIIPIADGVAMANLAFLNDMTY